MVNASNKILLIEMDGLGLTASHRRNIKPGYQYDKYFQKPKQNNGFLSHAASTSQTLDFMANIVKKDAVQVVELCKKELYSPNLDQFCKNVFDFAYNHFQYKLDKKGVEQLRSPNRAWHDRANGIDCDCFTNLCGAIMHSANKECVLVTCELENKGYHQHVYLHVPIPGRKYNQWDNSTYYTIDPVLNKYNTEAPKITDKNIKMIPVQYLDGLGNTNAMSYGNEFEGLSGLGCGCKNTNHVEQKFLTSVKTHLENTRKEIQKDPQKVGHIFNVQTLSGMLDFAIDNFDNPQTREASLFYLAGLEDAYHLEGMEGLTGLLYDEVEDLNGLGKTKAGKFFSKVASGVKQVSKDVQNTKVVSKVAATAKEASKKILKYNPLSTAARAGFILAMDTNLLNIANQLKWGYATKEEAERYISLSEWQKAKEALAKVENMFVNVLKGDKANLKKSIMHKRGLNGFDGLGNLGEPITAATTTTAAATFIAKAKDWVKALNIKPKLKKILANKELQQIAKDKATGFLKKKAKTEIVDNKIVEIPENETPTPEDNSLPTESNNSNSSASDNTDNAPPQTEAPILPLVPKSEKKKSNTALIVGFSLATIVISALVFSGSGKNSSKALSGIETEETEETKKVNFNIK